MIEQARHNLGKGKDDNDDRAIQIAGVQASIAIAELFDEVWILLNDLIGKPDHIDSGVLLVANSLDD